MRTAPTAVRLLAAPFASVSLRSYLSHALKHTDSFLTVDHEIAVAHLASSAIPPPNPPNMPPPNNFGGSIAGGLAIGPATPAGVISGPGPRRSPRRVTVTTIGPPGMDRAVALATPIRGNGKLCVHLTGCKLLR